MALWVLMLPLTAEAQNASPQGVISTRLWGQVRDSVSGEGVPYASVVLIGTDRGTLTDENGRFDLSTARPFTTVQVSAMGYSTKKVRVKKGRTTELKVAISPTGVLMNTVNVKPKKQKYSKKNNPAVAFMEKIRAMQDIDNPRTRPAYNYDKYERINIALNNFHAPDSVTGDKGNALLRQFPFLIDHIDTSEVSGNPILNIITREKASEVHYRNEPRAEKEKVLGLLSSGLDEMFDKASMQRLYEDVLREIDVYQNDITLLQNRFVSPLSRIAPDFYKFYLSDTVMIDSLRCVELTFVPRNSATFGFTGRFYVPQGDSTMFIKRIVMYLPKEINVNFIDQMYLVQDFDRAPDGARLKTRDDMVIEASLLPGLPGLYTRRNTNYTRHNFRPLTDQSIFNKSGTQINQAGAQYRTETFWDQHRAARISHGERSVGEMMRKLRQAPLFYWSERVLKVLVSGYIPTGNPSKIDIGPMNTTISFNDVEGLRLRAGGITTANLSRRWLGRAYGAYGFKDHKWKYLAEAEYSFVDKNYHNREFPVKALRLTHLFDVDMLGQHYMFTNPDNLFLSLKRKSDTQITYHRLTKLEYILELENNFSLLARLQTERQQATVYMPFVSGFGESFSHYTMNSLKLQLRYAPGEKFYQAKTYRFPINMDAPIFLLSHEIAPKGTFGNPFTLNKTEFSVQKRIWFSAFGYLDAIIKGGHVWSRVPYPNLIIPNANLSYTIQPEAFACLNPMEFLNDSYAQWDLTYWANGAIFNYIPLLKKLKLREAFSFRGFWGHLSHKNLPELNPDLFRFPADAHTQRMTSTPYMEAGIGVDNLFKILRVDYVWRLTYRNNPHACLGGVRIALHFTF